MKVLVIGSNGQIGQRIVKKLADKNHDVYAMIRDEKQKVELQAMGAETVVADLEKDISHAYKYKLDAVIFTAGSGGDTSDDKTVAVDLQGARKSIDEAVKNHVGRYIMVSALGTNEEKYMTGDLGKYFIAKSEADQHLVQSAINYTILRPGMLTNDPGNGNVKIAESLDSYEPGTITRDDVATVAVEVLDKPNTYKKVIQMVQGKTPVKDAVKQI